MSFLFKVLCFLIVVGAIQTASHNERRFKGVRAKVLYGQRQCLGRKTKLDDRLLLNYEVLHNESNIGFGNITLQIGNNPDSYRAEFLCREGALENMCVGDVRQYEVPISFILNSGIELLDNVPKKIMRKLDFNDVNDTLDFIITLKDILPEEENEEIEETMGEYIESLWEQYGGRNITHIKEKPRDECSRRTKNGDRVSVDYVVYVLGKYNDAVSDFPVTIGEEVEYENSCYNAEFFCRGELLLDMCVGDVREIAVPMRIAVGFGEYIIKDFKYEKYDLDVTKDTMNFTVTLQEIMSDDEYNDEL